MRRYCMAMYPETKFCTKTVHILGKNFEEVYKRVLSAKNLIHVGTFWNHMSSKRNLM